MSDAQDATNTAQGLTNDNQAQTNLDQSDKNDALSQGLSEVRTELSRVNTSLDSLSQIVPSLHSEVDEKVNEALDKAEDANIEARAIEERVAKADKKLTIKVVTPIVVLIMFAAANFYSLYETRQAASKIADCLEPQGECFQGNRETLGPFIEGIVVGVNNNTAEEADRAIDELKGLFCNALVNAELPAPPECDGLVTVPVVPPPPGE